VLYEEIEKASLSRVTNFSDDSKVLELKCKICDRVVNRTDLPSHILESHWKEMQPLKPSGVSVNISFLLRR
jgi:hypothetical protein